MRNRALSILCAAILASLGLAPLPVQAEPSPEGIAADIVVVRPLCLVATVVGSALFVVALPVAALSKSVRKTGNALVVKPAQATFTRPLGEFESLE
jgi:hypothetical protein